MNSKLKFFVILFLGCFSGATAQQQYFSQLPEYFSYVAKSRQTYSAYSREKADLLKLSESRDPAQIAAEYQGKLSEITAAYQQIYQSKVAAFNAGVNVAVGMVDSEYRQAAGAVGGAISDMFAASAQRNAEEQARIDQARLTLEFEEKMFTLKEDLLAEKKQLLELYLMAAAFQLSETEEKKYLDLANYLDCDCEYLKSNFSLGSTGWVNSNCPRPTTTRYAAVEAVKEPDANDLVAVIERKMRFPNIHFVRAARDFSDIGMAKYPNDKRFLYYRTYLCENDAEFDMFMGELMKVDADNPDVKKLQEYSTAVRSMTESNIHAGALKAAKEMSIATYEIYKNINREAGYIYPIYRNGKMIYVFPNGEKAIDDVYDFCAIFDNGYACVMQDGLWGVIDKYGKTVIPRVYKQLTVSFNPNSMTPLSHADEWNYMCVRTITRKWGVFAINGKWIIKPETFRPHILGKDRFLRAVDENGDYWHIFDGKGNKINDFGNSKFVGRHLIGEVVDNWFKIPVNSFVNTDKLRWTFMDADGNYVFGKNVTFDEIIDDGFVDGKCKVRVKKDIFYIDKTGKKIMMNVNVQEQRNEKTGANTMELMELLNGGTITYKSSSGIECKYIGRVRFTARRFYYDGQAQLWWGDNYYAGFFSRNNFHGYGTLVGDKGVTKSGWFVNDVFHSGFITDKDGKLIEIKMPNQ